MKNRKKKVSFRTLWQRYKWLVPVCCLILGVFAASFVLLQMPSSASGPLYGSSQMAESGVGELQEDVRAPDGMKLVTEDEELALFIDERSSEIALLHKASEAWWYSGPAGQDSQASASETSRIRSILQIRYSDQNNAESSMNSWQNSVQNGTFEYEFIEDGIRMNFVFEKGKVTREMLPAVVAKDKFEERILSKLSDEEKELIEKYYLLQKPGEMEDAILKERYLELYTDLDEEAEYYFLDLYMPKFKVEPVWQAVCQTAGYTAEEIEADHEEVGYGVPVDVFVRIEIPVEFVLDGGSLTVSIPASQIQMPEEYRLIELTLMPYFGCTGAEDEGYLFVPDGSGALIRFNNGKKSAYSYRLTVYGEDEGIQKQEAGFSQAKANVPVFGIVCQDEKAMLAVIEAGESHGTIEADVTGPDSTCNWVGSRFQITPMTIDKLANPKVTVETKRYQNEPYSGQISIRYLFAGADGADYSGLARLYREYLKENGVLNQADNGITCNVRLISKIVREASFLGIPYETAETVTSFSQADEIVNRMKEEGILEMNVGLSSWFGGGLHNGAVHGTLKPASSLGGQKALNQLLSDTDGYGNIALAADLLKVYVSWPRFNQFSYAARSLSNALATGYQFSPATYEPDKRRDTFYYLSTRYLESAVSDLSCSADLCGVSDLWLTDIGNTLVSDFHASETTDREVSKDFIVQAVAKAAVDHGITASDPNLYLWKYIDTAVDLPIQSSGHMLLDEDVPFLQIVLSGHVRYASAAFNRSGDLQSCFLKAVETGGDIYYEWIYEPDVEVSVLDGPETEDIYSLAYENWIDAAAEQYKRMKQELACAEGQEITGHSQESEGVFRTQYGGISVIVNYNDYEADVDGVTVNARDFVVLR